MSNDVTARATLNHFLRMIWRMSTTYFAVILLRNRGGIITPNLNERDLSCEYICMLPPMLHAACTLS